MAKENAISIALKARQSILNQTTLLCVRCGDGESIMLGADEAKKDFVLKRQLGHTLPLDLKKKVSASLVQAYSNADIIGIPDKKHLGIGDDWDKAEERVKKYSERGCSYASIDFHTEMLDTGVLDNLLGSVHNLLYISGHKLDFKKKYPNLKNVIAIQVPAEKKFAHILDERSHYPEVFTEVKRKIAETDLSGYLCLIGAGVVGKVYGLYCVRSGGVAIDLGSVFDLWAGKVTRKEGRGANVFSDKYQL